MPGYTTIDDPLATNTTGTEAHGINATGQIVGQYRGASGFRGFLYSGGTFTTLADPDAGSNTTLAWGINASGQVVGQWTGAGGTHGFLYSGGSNGTYTTLNDPSATIQTIARGINDTGQIVGYYLNGTGTHGFLYNPNGGT
jgi:probable HAF family extracellular repeat protein